MKLLIGSTLLLLLAGAPAYAGQEPDKDKPRAEPKKQEDPKNTPKPAEKPKQEPNHEQEKDRAKQQEERAAPPKPAQQQDRAQEQQRARQTEQHSDRANQQHANARRIPEVKFRASFGNEHHFHVERRDDRRFNYSGYWFTYSEPWPGDWDYNDDVYVEDIDGEYYLINPRHQGVRLLVIVGD